MVILIFVNNKNHSLLFYDFRWATSYRKQKFSGSINPKDVHGQPTLNMTQMKQIRSNYWLIINHECCIIIYNVSVHTWVTHVMKTYTFTSIVIDLTFVFNTISKILCFVRYTYAKCGKLWLNVMYLYKLFSYDTNYYFSFFKAKIIYSSLKLRFIYMFMLFFTRRQDDLDGSKNTNYYWP